MKEKLINIGLVLLKVVPKVLSIILKMSKVVLAGISFALYSYMFTWKFAAIIMVQLLIHEYGHIWAMQRVGMKTKGIYFIPFFGGAAISADDFKTRADEVFVAMMGPVFGFACAAATFLMYKFTGEAFYAAGASWMAMINLFNLLPINPLDGGRVFKSIAFSIKNWLGYTVMGIGIIASAFLALKLQMLLFIMVLLISTAELFMEYRHGIKMKKIVDGLRANYFEDCAKRNIIPLEPPQYIPEKPTMKFHEMLVSALAYFLLSILLYSFMSATMSVPGAAVAMEFLKD